MGFLRKTSPQRSWMRKDVFAERLSQVGRFANTDIIISILLWLLFVILCVPILSYELVQPGRTDLPGYFDIVLTTVIVVLVCLAAAFYIHLYQKRIIKNHARASALIGLFILLLAATKIATLLFNHTYGATATAVTAAIILTITYEQRFAIGMSIFYCLLACLAAGPIANHQLPIDEYQLRNISLFLTMGAGVMPCCFFLREIRTRMKLIEVSTLAAAMVFIIALALGFLDFGELSRAAGKSQPGYVFSYAGYHAGVTFMAGLLIQSLLPLIERIFRIATSMTLLDYSDANQPLLKRLAMEAPGTFSHSLLIGSIAEAAAEAIGRNGLLCRVGAYYHDVGKINKAHYFVENEMGLSSQHKELSPAMSQLIIVGHVKDGMEMAKEYGLPSVLWQFIETHHGTTLVEHFYNQARKLKTQNSKLKTVEEPSESEFRYPGPKPRTKEAAIVMLADTVEGAVRSLPEVTPMRIEAVVHNMAMKRLQDSQFDECDLSLRELSRIEVSISKTLAAHYHGRIAYPKAPDLPEDLQSPTGD
ncbi:MAG: HDIG domain-containing protein [Planctomycetota bacterium]|nr:HDIG domain-containing protein [Planctomycetota bacterium]